MLLSIFIIGLILGIVLLMICNKYWRSSFTTWCEPIAIILCTICTIDIIVSTIILIMKPISYKNFKIKYDTLKDTITSSDDIRDATFTKDLIEVNTEINKCRAYIDSKWIGIFFNKEMCELELLEK